MSIGLSLLGIPFTQSTDTTSPVLTTANVTDKQDTTVDLNVTTDEGNGTVYAVITTSATQPSIAQIIAGQDHTSTAATSSANQSVSATGVQTFNNMSGLSVDTSYYGHIVQRDASSNDSNRISTAVFTSNASTGQIYSFAIYNFLEGWL